MIELTELEAARKDASLLTIAVVMNTFRKAAERASSDVAVQMLDLVLALSNQAENVSTMIAMGDQYDGATGERKVAAQ